MSELSAKLETGATPSSMAAPSHQRLLALDLLRGAAALAIVLRHFCWPGQKVLVLPSSYLSVDLFFMLSGFVLTYTYENRLKAGMGMREFLWLRILRLYPLYIVALIIGSISVATLIALGAGPMNTPEWAASSLFGLAMLPTPAPFAPGWRMFAINSPSWSLFAELVVNVFFGCLASSLDRRRLTRIIIASLIVLVLLVADHGRMDLGWKWPDLYLGIARCTFAFFAGVALCRLRATFPPPALSPWLPVLLMLTPMMLPGDSSPCWALVTVIFVYPVVIWLGSAPRKSALANRLGQTLGDLSYPIYVLQIPVLLVCTVALRVIAGERMGQLPLRDLAIYVLATLAAGYCASRYLDKQLRRLMRGLAAGNLGLANSMENGAARKTVIDVAAVPENDEKFEPRAYPQA